MTPALHLHAIAQFSALRIVDSVIEGTLIGVFAAILLRVARRQSAGARFAAWFSALMSIVVLPFVRSGLWLHSGTAATSRQPAITVPDSWAVYLFAIWAVVAVWSLVGVGRAVWHLRMLRKSCVPIDVATLDSVLRETFRRYPMKRSVALCTSEQVRVPTAIGLVKPAVVMPRWVMEELTPVELNQIVLHELAHLRRWDDWTNLAQQLVKAFFFFHPAVWWIERKLALEREMACDDAVVAETASPRAYAECLAHLAERSFVQRGLALAQAALGRVRQISFRVAQILDANRPTERARNWKPAALLITGFAIVCAVFGASMPQLIGFQNGEPVRVSGSTLATSSPHIISPTVISERGSEVPSHRIVSTTAATSQAPRIVQARLNARTGHRNLPVQEQRVALRHDQKPQTSGMVHLASGERTTPAPITETVFVLIESRPSGSPEQQGYRIQMWRLTVLRQVVDPTGTQPPRKQT